MIPFQNLNVYNAVLKIRKKISSSSYYANLCDECETTVIENV